MLPDGHTRIHFFRLKWCNSSIDDKSCSSFQKIEKQVSATNLKWHNFIHHQTIIIVWVFLYVLWVWYIRVKIWIMQSEMSRIINFYVKHFAQIPNFVEKKTPDSIFINDFYALHTHTHIREHYHSQTCWKKVLRRCNGGLPLFSIII